MAIQLNEDKFCTKVPHILSEKCCFRRAIHKEDLERIKWLGSLVLNSSQSKEEKIEIYLTSSYYCFREDKDEIGKWLSHLWWQQLLLAALRLDNLFELELTKIGNNGDGIGKWMMNNLFGYEMCNTKDRISNSSKIIDDVCDKKIDLLYYLLDKFRN